jgi:CRISPR-associated protein Cmr5
MQTIQQLRAKFALTAVEQAAKMLVEEKSKKEYKSYASALPFMIHANGLGQAAAFYRSKGDTHQELYILLSGWLTGEGQPLQGHKDLLAGITQSDMHTYLAAQAEAMAFLEWVKRFADALIETKKG